VSEGRGAGARAGAGAGAATDREARARAESDAGVEIGTEIETEIRREVTGMEKGSVGVGGTGELGRTIMIGGGHGHGPQRGRKRARRDENPLHQRKQQRVNPHNDISIINNKRS
jgi:hypothetical protein